MVIGLSITEKTELERKEIKQIEIFSRVNRVVTNMQIINSENHFIAFVMIEFSH